MNLDDIKPEIIYARGQYATVRAEHEDAKKRLSVLCGQMGTVAPQILRHMQPDNDDLPAMAAVDDLIDAGREYIEKIEQCVSEIEELAQQRASLKQAAWGKK